MCSKTGNLSVGFDTPARMESVAIDVVRPDELLNIYLNYANAVLVELYRQKKNQDILSQTEVTGYLLKRFIKIKTCVYHLFKYQPKVKENETGSKIYFSVINVCMIILNVKYYLKL